MLVEEATVLWSPKELAVGEEEFEIEKEVPELEEVEVGEREEVP